MVPGGFWLSYETNLWVRAEVSRLESGLLTEGDCLGVIWAVRGISGGPLARMEGDSRLALASSGLLAKFRAIC